MKKNILIIFLLVTSAVFAQVNIPDVIPPSPNAQTFLKYGDFPVSNYLGIPDIDIPLYNISLKDISVPISISYNSSGIKVDEEAGRVGLGWALNAGGIITHTIMGRYNDFQDEVYFNSFSENNLSDLTGIYPYPLGFTKYTIGSYSSPLPFNCPNITKYDFWCGLSGDDPSCGGVELAPDLFNYNFMGYSGKFIFSHSGNIIKEKEDNLIIELTSQDNINPAILKSWKITTPDLN